MKIVTRAAAFLALLAATPAHAHFGHVGEVAGHSHWIGVAAASAAAAIAIAVSVLGKKKEAGEDDAEPKAEEASGDEAPVEG